MDSASAVKGLSPGPDFTTISCIGGLVKSLGPRSLVLTPTGWRHLRGFAIGPLEH